MFEDRKSSKLSKVHSDLILTDQLFMKL